MIEQFLQLIFPIIRKNLLAVALGTAGLICLVYGLIGFSSQNAKNDIIFTSTDQQSASDSATKASSGVTVYIDVSGAVKNPGVYQLPEDSRVQDALAAAGGLRDDADTALIAKQMNLALKVSDGMKLYIPIAGETGSVSSLTIDKHVNINSASDAELDNLKGVGKVTAEKIIDGRPYTSIEELVSKKVISQKVFDQIKEQISTF